MENVTIRVLINIAAGNKYEGNSEVEIVLEEMHLIGSPKFTNRMVTDKIAGLIDAAIIDYVRNNGIEPCHSETLNRNAKIPGD